MNSPVVFDDMITKEYLQSIKLTFLCGLYISKVTLNDISFLVKNNGLVVVTGKHFVPDKFAQRYSKGTVVFNGGKGKWIVTDDMSRNNLKYVVASWLGHNNEIMLRFKEERAVLKISLDGKKIRLIQSNQKGAEIKNIK